MKHITKVSTNDQITDPDFDHVILGHRLVDACKHLILCYKVSQERLQLSKMTVEQLDDVGLNHSSAVREARRGFFDIPSEREEKPVSTQTVRF